ncbi:MAG: hypothetical protein U0414_37915 [Polyangiaceae bacterium]
MQRSLRTGSFLIALAAAGCATGATIDGAGGAGSGGAAASTGKSSSTNSMSTSTQSSMSTTSSTQSSMSTASMMTSTGVDPNCPEQPCKLTSPQCGCTADRQCSLDANNDRTCILEGSAPVGASCGTGNQCVPGSMCLGPAVGALSCLEFCDMDNDCTGPGGICYFTLDDGSGGAVPGVKLCTQNCDPTNNSGCAAGLGCQAVRDTMTMQTFTFCPKAGTGGDGASCATNGFADCKPGFGCFTSNGSDVCLQWCKVGGSCPNALTCYSLLDPLIIGSTEYGVCN